MSKTKKFYHDEICAAPEDPQADYPNPEEEEWYSKQDKDDEWIEGQEPKPEQETDHEHK